MTLHNYLILSLIIYFFGINIAVVECKVLACVIKYLHKIHA